MDVFSRNKQLNANMISVNQQSGTEKTKKEYSIRSFLFPMMVVVLYIILTAAVPLQAWGSQASIRKNAFEWEPIKQTAKRFFGDDAAQFIKIMENYIGPASMKIPKEGLSRSYVDRVSYHLFMEIAHLISPILFQQDIVKVNEFFKTINHGRWIVGWHSSPTYSGDSVVSIELEISKDREYKVDFQHWTVESGRKKNVFTIRYGTSVRALPIYQKNDKIIFANANSLKIRNQTWGDRQGPQYPTIFTLKHPCFINEIATGHWPYKPGSATGTIMLKEKSGDIYGPWQTTPLARFGGYNNVYWLFRPNILLKPGTYEIIDSDSNTWINNDRSGRQGMSWVIGSTTGREGQRPGVKP